MPDSVVEMGDDRFVTLPLQNHGKEKQYLKKGMQLGVASPATVLSVGDKAKENQREQDTEPEIS